MKHTVSGCSFTNRAVMNAGCQYVYLTKRVMSKHQYVP